MNAITSTLTLLCNMMEIGWDEDSNNFIWSEDDVLQQMILTDQQKAVLHALDLPQWRQDAQGVWERS